MEKDSKKIEFLAVGDIVIDAFIRLKDAHVNCNVNNEGCELCLRFGDKIPYESVTVLPAVGNSGNAAVAAARLGLCTALVTNIGDDKYGEDCLDKLKKEKIDVSFVDSQKDKSTNYHYVLWYETERTILIKHQKYERIWPKALENFATPSWVYFSSLGEDSLEYHFQIADYLENHKNAKLAFQPGTYQIKFGTEKLKNIYAHTEALFCNKEEAEKILNLDKSDILILAKGLSSLGPKNIFISDAENGAYFYENENLWHLPIYSNGIEPFERTGAGDAFSSTIVSYMAKGFSPIEAFKRGQINSMFVIQSLGAQEGLLSYEKIEEYLKNAPENYKIKKIN